MLDEYTTAFARYLRTGTVGALSDFCGEHPDLARLRVYRNGFIRACVEALRASYPSVERIAGEERFPALARPYVETHPPRVANLTGYGEGFPRFIEDARETHRLDHLASFAALDRAWTEVYFAEDPDPGAEAAETVLAGAAPGNARDDAGGHEHSGRRPAPAERPAPLPEPDRPGTPGPASGVHADAEALMNLRGHLSPWVRMVSLEYRVLHAWSGLRQGGPGRRRTGIPHTPQQVLIWRSGAEVLYRDLTPPEHTFFTRVAAGRPCGEAAGAALDVDAAFDPVATFASLLHHRMLAFEP